MDFWQKFLLKLKEKKELIIYNAICDFKIHKVNEDTISIQYPSETAKTEFDKVSPQFFSELKHKVNHFSIQVEYHLNKQMRKEKITRKMVFEKMAETTPLLIKLNEIFKFDLTE